MLTFAWSWSWTCWLVSVAIKPQSPPLATTLMFVGSFGPSLAAVLVVANAGGRAGLRAWLGRCLQWPNGWRQGWRWVAFAVLFPGVLTALAAALHVVMGGSIGPSPAAGHGVMMAANLFLVLLLVGPLGEEFGWRGYALPRLQPRMDWRMASLGIGLVWGVWHLPLFFIEGTSQAHIPLALVLLSVVAMSVLFAWLVDHTKGSVVAALLLHTAINFWPSILPVLPTETSYQAYALVVAMLVLTALWLLAPHRAVSADSRRT